MSMGVSFKLEDLRPHLGQVAMYLMLGMIIGFLYFQKIFPYFSSPVNAEMPTLLFVLFLISIGAVSGYLYPDITNVLASAILLPLLGGLFCFLIFISPTLSRDIMASGLGEDLVLLARLLLFDMLMSFLVIFVAGFGSVYLFESAE